MAKDKTPHRLFLMVTSLIVSLSIASISFFNFLVNPFNLYDSPLIEGFNAVKVDLEKHERLFKEIDIIKKRPDSLVLGASRVTFGFDLDDLEKITHTRFYNAGLAGANFDEIYETFLHALYVQPHLKQIILGIDFFAFNKGRENQADFSLDRLKRKGLTYKDMASSLFTLKALSLSLKTIKYNRADNPVPAILADGQGNSSWNGDKTYNGVLQLGDYSYLESLINAKPFYKDYILCQERIQKFKNLVEICKAASIDLKVFICPTKAIYWETYYQHGLWPVLENLKKELCAIYPIWDFSGYNAITTETFNSQAHPLYFECSHFTPYTGHILLQHLFELSPPCQAGYLLTPQTVENVLEIIQQERLIWVENNQENIAKIKAFKKGY